MLLSGCHARTSDAAASGGLRTDLPTAASSRGSYRELQPQSSGREVCFNALDDNANGLLDEGCDVPQGQIQIALSWESNLDDLDLIVADSDGEIATTTAPTSSGLTLLRDCPSDDACTEQPYELVYLEDAEPPAGRLEIAVVAQRLQAGREETRAYLGISAPSVHRSFELRFAAEQQRVQLSFELPKREKKTQTKKLSQGSPAKSTQGLAAEEKKE